MSIFDLSLLDMCNAISQDVVGTNCSDTKNPKKAKIVRMVNTTYQAICALHKDFTFLNQQITVDAFNNDSSTATTVSVGVPYIGSDVETGTTGTDLMAQPITITRDATTFETVTFKLSGERPIIASQFGTLTAYIYSDDSNPNAVLLTSNSLAVVGGVITGVGTLDYLANLDVPFTFTDADPLESGTYWVVLEYIPDPINGQAIYIARDNGAGSQGNLSKYKIGSGTWTDRGYNTYYSIVTTSGTLTKSISIPNTVREIYAMYGGSQNVDLSWDYAILPEFPIREGELLFSDKYRIKRETNGQLYIEINPSKEYLTWQLEAKVKPLELVEDTDVPYIPSDYRDILITKVVYDLLAEGYGLNSETRLPLLMTKYLERITDMEMALRDPAKEIAVDLEDEPYTPGGPSYGSSIAELRGRG